MRILSCCRALYRLRQMIKRDSITFAVWENDPSLEIQLEPEALVFTVNPGEELTFVVKNPSQEFSWTIRHERD